MKVQNLTHVYNDANSVDYIMWHEMHSITLLQSSLISKRYFVNRNWITSKSNYKNTPQKRKTVLGIIYRNKHLTNNNKYSNAVFSYVTNNCVLTDSTYFLYIMFNISSESFCVTLPIT